MMKSSLSKNQKAGAHKQKKIKKFNTYVDLEALSAYREACSDIEKEYLYIQTFMKQNKIDNKDDAYSLFLFSANMKEDYVLAEAILRQIKNPNCLINIDSRSVTAITSLKEPDNNPIIAFLMNKFINFYKAKIIKTEVEQSVAESFVKNVENSKFLYNHIHQFIEPLYTKESKQKITDMLKKKSIAITNSWYTS